MSSQILSTTRVRTPPARSAPRRPGRKCPKASAPDARREQAARAAALLKQHDAVLVAHYYVDGDVQDLALEYRRLRRRFARDGAFRARSSRDDAGRLRRSLHGRDGENPVAGQACADARPRCHLLARPRLPARRIRALLRRASRPHGRRLCQHQRGGEGARRLDGDEFVRAADRQSPVRAAARRSCGRRIAISATRSSNRPAPTCCCGTAPVSCTTSSRAWSWS